jgi:hypothetical protein
MEHENHERNEKPKKEFRVFNNFRAFRGKKFVFIRGEKNQPRTDTGF